MMSPITEPFHLGRKLTDEQVRALLEDRYLRRMSQGALAEKYGLTTATVSKIVRGVARRRAYGAFIAEHQTTLNGAA